VARVAQHPLRVDAKTIPRPREVLGYSA
jgi:hypothetical protein